MESKRMGLVLGVAAAIFCNATAVFLAVSLAQPSAARETPVPLGHDRGLVAVEEKLDAIVRSLEGMSSLEGEVTRREPQRPVEGTSDLSIETVERLVVALEQIAQERQALGGPSSRVPPRRPEERDWGAALREVNTWDSEKRRKEHLFWSFQDVLDRYGVPHWIGVLQSGVVQAQFGVEGAVLVFSIYDGYVFDAQ